MGWFWADTPATVSAQRPQQPISPPAACPRSRQSRDGTMPDATPPSACPMHKRTIEAFGSAAPSSSSSSSSSSSCPVPHGGGSSTTTTTESSSTLSRLNPLNYMFRDLSQAPAPNQVGALPMSREESTIPKGGGTSGNWEYPSPQQMYNALLRKGYSDTDVTAVESMVAVHNFLNEGAWAEIVEWERRFGRGLRRGWDICRRGEENADEAARRVEAAEARAGRLTPPPPTLVRFQGRPRDMTPKAAMVQVMGWLYPAKFGTEPPFDRHDWYVSRTIDGKQSEVRYVIDYYSGPPEPTGEPVFYLDVRPAITPTGAMERLMRWGGDVWWRGTGGEARETQAAVSKSTK